MSPSLVPGPWDTSSRRPIMPRHPLFLAPPRSRGIESEPVLRISGAPAMLRGDLGMSQQTKDLVEEPAAAAVAAVTPGPARLSLDGKDYELPVVVGSEGEVGVDIQQLRAKSGAITLDPGYGNTGACESAITFIDGEAGILRYRGYPIEEVAGNAQFTEICYLLIYGRLPNAAEHKEFEGRLTYHTLLHEDMKKFFEGFPSSAHPMAMLSSMVASLSAYYPDGTKSLDLDLN